MDKRAASAKPQRHALPATRRAHVAAFVEERGAATVSDLVDSLGVSADTIRRDLDELTRKGVLDRTHGGATRRTFARWDRPFDTRLLDQWETKEKIGIAAADLLEDSQTVLINGGTTTLAVVRALRGLRDLTIVTNNLRIPSEIDTTCVRELYLLGGNCRFASLVTVGPVEFPGMSPNHAHKVIADIAVVGVGGISTRNGLSTTNLYEARMILEMIDSAATIVLVIDSSKFERNAFAQIAELDRADILVTDSKPPAELAQALKGAGVDVVIAG
jgi:DeoR family transcriptional regulator, fructose operon transcriptional repressor